MNWFENLFFQPGVAHSVLLIGLVVSIGFVFSHIRIKGVSFGVTWILFVGILAGQLGLNLDDATAHFVKEFGLMLFIFSIGIEVGPGFFQSFKRGGVLLNSLAMSIIFLGCIMMMVIQSISGEEKASMVGVLYGAVTNTPGLGAAQQTYADLHGGTSNALYAQGYAVAYPLAVVGIILSITLLNHLFKVNDAAEETLFESNAHRNGATLQRENARSTKPSFIVAQEDDHPHLFYIFLGLALGVVLGMVPIPIPGIPVPIRLGLAGGPLIVSILLSHFGPRLHIPTHTTKSANLMIREIGISLFMASVGIGAGQGFVDTLCDGGYLWVVYGFVITTVPCLVVGVAARYVFHLSTFTIAGLISGSMTDPPALAYSNSLCSDQQASIAYSTVYPLTMFLRVLMAQVLVIML